MEATVLESGVVGESAESGELGSVLTGGAVIGDTVGRDYVVDVLEGTVFE